MDTRSPQKYAQDVRAEIDLLISSMMMSYDAKTLGTLLLHRGAHLLRAVHSTKLWKVEDVRVVVEAALEDIYEPLSREDTPQVTTTEMTSVTKN